MAELILSSHLARLAEKGRIDAGDVFDLRQSIFADGVVCKDEAVALFALNTNCADKCREWDEFFVEALTDFIVDHVEPSGYVSEKQAGWLISAVSRGQTVASRAELELLVRVLEKAQRSPEALSAFVLEQVAEAVLEGAGPLWHDGRKPRVITARDVVFLRRVLYAFGGDAAVGISRAEAEVLFRLNDQSIEAENDPSWSDLYVKAIANYMMAVSHYSVPAREEALRRDEWLENHASDRSFFSRMIADGLSGILRAYIDTSSLEESFGERNREREVARADAERVDAQEARWLVNRINRDGYIRSNEKALLSFLKKESTAIHPDLQPLLDMVA